MQKQNKKILVIILIALGISIAIGFMSRAKATSNGNTAILASTNAQTDVTDQFIDENLKNAILEKVKEVTKDTSKTTITLGDLEAITADDLPSGKQLNLAGKNISNLAGLELLADKQIEWIYLDWNQISDIKVLQNFKGLTKISASGNQITDITAIGNLETVTNLNFSNNKISSIQPIQTLTNLNYCYLDNNQITDVSALSSLSQLKELSIAGNKLNQIEPLFTLPNLETIDISRNQITQLSLINPNQTLQKLNINNNQLNNITGIEKLPNLKVLSASNNQISDITALAEHKELYNLNLNQNAIMDTTPLTSCENLQYVYLDGNHIVDSSPLEKLTKVTKLTVYNQTYELVIQKDYGVEELKIHLTSFFTNLKNPNSKLYAPNVTYHMENNITYTVANDMSYLIVKASDLQKEELIFSMKEEEHTYITLILRLEIKPEPPEDNKNDNAQEEKPQEDQTYYIKNGYIRNVAIGTSVRDFKNKAVTGGEDGYVTRNGEIIKDTEVVRNGDILKLGGNSYPIIVKADPSGDGKTNITDLMKVKRQIMGIQNMNEIETLAADINEDGKINITDTVNFVKTISQNK